MPTKTITDQIRTVSRRKPKAVFSRACDVSLTLFYDENVIVIGDVDDDVAVVTVNDVYVSSPAAPAMVAVTTSNHSRR